MDNRSWRRNAARFKHLDELVRRVDAGRQRTRKPMNDDMELPTVELPIDVERIPALLPHRYPFLLVDRVVEFEPGKRVLAHQERHASTSRSSRAISPAIR